MDYNELKKLFVIFRLPFMVFVIDKFFNIPFDLYKIFPWLDIPMHLIGGAAIGASFFSLLQYKHPNLKIAKTERPFLFFWVVGMVSFAAIVWEFYEFTSDYFFQTIDQPSNADTIGDLFFGLLGGGLAGWYMMYWSDRVKK